MYYIYTLSVDNVIFYVGVSQHPHKRYIEHHKDSLSLCYKITRACNSLNRPVTMRIVSVAYNKAISRLLEGNYIELFSTRFYLMNYQNYLYSQGKGICAINYSIPDVKYLNMGLINKEVDNIKIQMLNYGQK